jgi:hypothetical protein
LGYAVSPHVAARVRPDAAIVWGATPLRVGGRPLPSARYVVGGLQTNGRVQWLDETCGAPPTSIAERTRWASVVRDVLAFRERWQCRDAPSALGQFRGDIERRLEYRQLERDVRGLRRELGLGRELPGVAPALSIAGR